MKKVIVMLAVLVLILGGLAAKTLMVQQDHQDECNAKGGILVEVPTTEYHACISKDIVIPLD